MKAKIKKLSRISFDEVRVRSSQAWSTFLERKNWLSRSRLVSDEALVRLFDARKFSNGLESAFDLRDHFKVRTEPRFFTAFDDPDATIHQFRRRWPQLESDIIDRADRIEKGHFDLLGFRDLNFGDPIDWHFEPISGKRAPLVHWSRLDYLDPELFGDKKIIWELNRHQYFITLGQAYWLTADERYAETFIAHLNSWMDHNPPKLGINWASSLEVSFRSISWLWALYFFRKSPLLTPQLFSVICKFLYLNARHIETYLSTYFSPNTHLTGESLGLFYLGTLLPEFKEAKRWRHTGLRILLRQLGQHVQADGVYFEQSSYYHRYTTDFYIHLYLLLSINHEAVPAELEEKLKSLLDHLMYITRPDGTTPFFGDDDGGRLLGLSPHQANDFRTTLATGAGLFARADYKFVSEGAADEALWLVGSKGIEALDLVEPAMPARESIAFPSGGYYVMRDGWNADSNYLLFDCGPHGTANCGHAHADALSFELAVNGRKLFVDPGTYTYTGSKESRDWFRSSFAHNTLTVDDVSSSISGGPFSWKTIARSECYSWTTQEQFDYVVASHDGFERLSEPTAYTRSILFLKNNYWVLRDEVASPGAIHKLKMRFHLDSKVGQLHSKDNAIRLISENGSSAVLQMVVFASNGEWINERGWVSQCYGEKKEAPVFVFSLVANGSEELVTFLLPEVAGVGEKSKVHEIEALDGRAFEIELGGRHDILMLRDRCSNSVRGWVETARFASDFDLAWARFDRKSSRTPDELVLIKGHTLEFEGRPLLRSTKEISYVAAKRVGDRFRVETEDGKLEIYLPVPDLEAAFSNMNHGLNTA